MERKYYKYIYFEPTYRCNYKCEYCIQKQQRNELNNSEALNAPDDVVDGFIKFVNSLEKKSFFQLLGGEIFIHPRIYEILDVILKNGHDLEIITNFSFPLENYKKMIEMNVKNSKIMISISLHLSQVNIEDFKNKVKSLANILKDNDDVKYCVRTVLLEENFEKLVKLDEDFVGETGQHVEFQNLVIGNKEYVYREKIENYMKQRYYTAASYNKKYKSKYKHAFGNRCSAGESWVCIFTQGQIKRCFNEQYALAKLGDIREGKVDFYNKPMPCLSDCCNCSVFFRFGLTDYSSRPNFLLNTYYRFRYIYVYKLKLLKRFFPKKRVKSYLVSLKRFLLRQ